jgi:hypothetical protein
MVMGLFSQSFGQSDNSEEALSEEKTKTQIYYADKPKDTTILTQSPTEALFRSLFIPGWGQMGNKKYIKATVIMSLEAVLIGTVIHYYKKKSDAWEAFETETDEAGRVDFFNTFLDARDQHGRFSWYLGTLIFLSMFDAYVDAHLASFPKYDKRLSIDISPPNEDIIGLNITYKF